MGYANHFKRLLAGVIDVGILWALEFVVMFVITKTHPGDKQAVLLATFLFILVAIVYFAWFESSSWQATPGKRIAGLKVTDLEGKKIGIGKGLARAFGKCVDVITYGIGVLMLLWTEKRQGLHDKIAATVVVSEDTGDEFFESHSDVRISKGTEGKIAELKQLLDSGILNKEEYELAIKKLKS